jgi:hypothetical protein
MEAAHELGSQAAYAPFFIFLAIKQRSHLTRPLKIQTVSR